MVTTFNISSVDIPKRQKLELSPGNTIRVWQRIQEKGKTRLQAFEGLLIARKHGTEPGATFTIRRVSGGVGVEKTFPLYSPNIEKIEVVKRSKVRRAKLYYIRDKAAKEIRRRTKRLSAIAAEKAKEAEKALSEAGSESKSTPEADVNFANTDTQEVEALDNSGENIEDASLSESTDKKDKK